jgi:type IV pilus assembly protein PilE
MNTLNRKRTFGFTVIELMIVVVIIAILTALAYPSYTKYARKAKRGEAQQLLMNWAINQEIWRSNNPSYASADPDSGTGFASPAHEHYDFVVYRDPGNTETNPDATRYVVEATAKSSSDQANDTAKDGTSCATLTVSQSGVKTPPSCWN